jgi:hypothetical protein
VTTSAASDSAVQGRSAGRLLVAAILVFCGWMFVHPFGIASDDAYRDNDWFTDRAFDALARDALLHHGQLPLRSHQLGGGFPTLGHPFDGSTSPTMLPVLLSGDVIGVKIVLALLLLLGSWGIWGLARRWLEVRPASAALATLAFAFSGWLPSMLLVGFYPQAFFLLTPALLRLLWVERSHPWRSLLLAGALFSLLVGQAGNAALAVAFFVAVATGFKVAAEQSRWVLAAAAGLLLAITAPLAFAAELESWLPVVISWAVVAGLMGGVPALRRFARSLAPWLGRGAVVGVVATLLGLGKIIAIDDLLHKGGEYQHELSWGYEFWFPRLPHGEPDGRLLRFPRFDEANPPPPYRDPDFYMGPAELLEGLLGRVPSSGEYSPFPPPSGDAPMEERPFGMAEREYMWLGLTAPLLLLGLIGVVLGRRGRGELGLLFVTSAGICLGPHLLPDLHFLLVRGLPGFDRIVQPIKYFNFFLVPIVALLAALALDRLPARRERLAWIAVPLLVAWPFVQNGTALEERFRHAYDPPDRVEFSQIAHVGHPDWVHWEREEIERLRQEWSLRELARPAGAREYELAKAGLGIVDYYGTVELPERAIPARYVTPSGAWFDNPSYPGAEAWFSGGAGELLELEIGPTRLRAVVETSGPTRLVFNQNHLPEFVARGGEVVDDVGLVAVDIPEAGRREVEVIYRPIKLLLGLLGSLVAWIVWGILVVRSGRRRPA